MKENNLIEERWYWSGAHTDAPIVKYLKMEDEVKAKFIRIGSDLEGEAHYADLREIAILPLVFEELTKLKETVDNGIVYIKGHYFFGFEANNPDSECYVSEYNPDAPSKPKLLGKIRTISELQGLININYLGTNNEIVDVIKRNPVLFR